MDQDLDLMKELGVGSYRFSVAWPRVQPDGKGPANQAGLDFYRRLVDGLLKREIEPTLTLYHWDLPQPIEDEGGWCARDSVERFGEYVDIVARALGDSVERWITLNEPWCSAWLGYGRAATRRASRTSARPSPRRTTCCSRTVPPYNTALGDPGRQSRHHPQSGRLAPRHDPRTRSRGRASSRWNLNRIFLDPVFKGHYPEDMLDHYKANLPGFSVVQDGDMDVIAQPLDFLGVNYYFRAPSWTRRGSKRPEPPATGAHR